MRSAAGSHSQTKLGCYAWLAMQVMMDAIMAARSEMKALAAELGVPKFTLMPLLMKVGEQATRRCYAGYHSRP